MQLNDIKPAAGAKHAKQLGYKIGRFSFKSRFFLAL